MKTELIEALKKTIDDLRFDRKHYSWMNGGSCNCGVLAQNICGITELDVLQGIEWKNGDTPMGWKTICSQTGMGVFNIASRLIAVGLTQKDIDNMEFLKDKEILKEAGILERLMRHIDKEDVIKYMEGWVRILEREVIAAPKSEPIKELQNKPMEFVTFKEMKEEQELIFSN